MHWNLIHFKFNREERKLPVCRSVVPSQKTFYPAAEQLFGRAYSPVKLRYVIFVYNAGLHAVADIYCDCCKTTLGWKYEQAYESSQKYKEGKFIIELAHMIKENGWENDSV